MARVSHQRDGRFDTDVILALVRNAQVGQRFPFPTLLAAVNQNRTTPLKQDRLSNVIGQVNRQLLRQKNRMLISVRSVGYQMASASEQRIMAGRYQSRSLKAMERSKEIIDHTRISELPVGERQQFKELTNAVQFSTFMLQSAATRENRIRAVRDQAVMDQLDHIRELTSGI